MSPRRNGAASWWRARRHGRAVALHGNERLTTRRARVERRTAYTARLHQARLAEDREVLGDTGGREPQAVGDLGRGARRVEVGDLEREPGMAFLQMGDQFLALSESEHGPADRVRHFGLVVDDKEAVRRALRDEGVTILPGPRLDFLDPWGNRVQVVDYRDIRFTKTPQVLGAMGLGGLSKRS